MNSFIIAIILVGIGYFSFWVGINYSEELEPFFYWWNRTVLPLTLVYLTYQYVEHIRGKL